MIVYLSSFPRICWCWKNRRYERIKCHLDCLLVVISQSFVLNYLLLFHFPFLLLFDVKLYYTINALLNHFVYLLCHIVFIFLYKTYICYSLLSHFNPIMILQGSVNFKFGVLYAKDGQLTDDEMFSNGKALTLTFVS